MTKSRALRGSLAVLFAFLLLALAACGDDGDSGDDDGSDDSVEETDDSVGTFDPDAGDDDDEQSDEEQSTFADDIEEQVADEISLPSGDPYSGYSEIVDDTGALFVSVPDEWDEIDGTPIDDEENRGPALAASSDLDGYFETYDTPGMVFHASFVASLDTEEAAESFSLSDCDNQPAEELDLEDDFYFGHVVVGLDCAGTDTDFVTIAADRDVSAEGAVVIIQVQLVTTADLEAFEEILATFIVDNPND